ncbi:MAG TPA: tRNA (adenine-N1)-methyltransferase [Thermoplasmatales archaeon]|nr:tRNA (adenine-N1)-methyltransferase [Thermoplasmatales archaeon]
MSVVSKGDEVVLIDSKGKRCIINTDQPPRKIKGFGIVDPDKIVGREYGKKVKLNSKTVWILKARAFDRWASLKRKAQIILPKDAAHIVINCSIVPGSIVVEGGIGSGSLTAILSQIVGPTGKIISYERRKDFREFAVENLKNVGLFDNIEVKERDITKGIDERDIDAIVLDIPNPWDVVEHAWNALKIGGNFCSYSPLISQVERTVKKLREFPFTEIKVIETLQREIVVTERGCRPSFDMLGHTGYLTFGRKVLEV